MHTKTEPVLAEFQAAYEWLLSLITDPSGQRYLNPRSYTDRLSGMKEQVPRTAAYLEYIGNPQQQFNSIHVAGTSGKGSVTAMLASCLYAAGIRSGQHVSPYLQVCTEKLVANQQMISPSQFARLVEDFREDYTQWQTDQEAYPALKYGEAWVVLTYMFLLQHKVDWAVIEPGMGGRYDPTNALDGDLALITNIDLDHTESLGSTLAEIASHKAGIIKPGKIAVTGEGKPEALSVIRTEARRLNVPLFALNEDFSYEMLSMDDSGTRLHVHAPFATYRDLKVHFPGRFQAENAALAVAAMDVLREKRGLPITDGSIRKGLAAAQIAGRMEVMQRSPTVMIDAAHNPAKMGALVRSLQQLYPGKQITTIFGALSIKDMEHMLTPLAEITDCWVATQPHVMGKPAAPAEVVAEQIRETVPRANVKVHENVHTAIASAISDADPDDLIVVTGSLYLVGAARGFWVSGESLLEAAEEHSDQ